MKVTVTLNSGAPNKRDRGGSLGHLVSKDVCISRPSLCCLDCNVTTQTTASTSCHSNKVSTTENATAATGGRGTPRQVEQHNLSSHNLSLLHEDSHFFHPHTALPAWRRWLGLLILPSIIVAILSAVTTTAGQIIPPNSNWGATTSTTSHNINHHYYDGFASSFVVGGFWISKSSTKFVEENKDYGDDKSSVAAVPPSSKLSSTTASSSFRTSSANQTSVCIPGGGFSGFWFTLGQLQSSLDLAVKQSHDYYCYSAGCLCVVAFLADLSVHETLDLALEASRQWRAGNISRFQVVPHFVDGMIQLILEKSSIPRRRQQKEKKKTLLVGPNVSLSPSSLSSSLNANHRFEWLNNLRIITGVRNNNAYTWGLVPSVRSPEGPKHNDDPHDNNDWIVSFRTMLLQTTWIPLAVGDSWFLEDHIDGVFVAGQVRHQCERTIPTVWNWELLATSLNTQLTRDKALNFWQAGLEHGRTVGIL